MQGTTLRWTSGWALVAAAVAVAALTWASPAQAGFKKGPYVGTTSEGEEIAFSAGKQRLRQLAYAVTAPCQDEGMALRGEISGKAPIGPQGRFSLRVEGTDPQWGHFLAAEVRGRLKRKRARGRILADGNRVDGTPCSSSVTWSARYRSARGH